MTLSGLNHLGHRESTLSWFEVSKQAEAEAFWDLICKDNFCKRRENFNGRRHIYLETKKRYRCEGR